MNLNAENNNASGPCIDIHICGACKTQFNDVEAFIVHKRQECPMLQASGQTPAPPSGNVCEPSIVAEQPVPVACFAHLSQREAQSEAETEANHVIVTSSGETVSGHMAPGTAEPAVTINNAALTNSMAPSQGTYQMVHPSSVSQPLVPGPSAPVQTTSICHTINSNQIGANPGFSLQAGATNVSIDGTSIQTSDTSQKTIDLGSNLQIPAELLAQMVSTTAAPTTSVTVSSSPAGVTSGKSPSTTGLVGNSPSKSPVKSRSNPTKKFKCDYPDCNFSTAYHKDLERHIRTHTGERPFVCHVCNKSFNRADKLKVHVRGHTGNKPYKCEQCDYAAADSSSLKKHMRIHTDERPFKCQICSYASRNSSQLIVHLRTHTGDSPFMCHMCNARFKINSDLKRHLRMHTGEKPYKCELCNYRCAIKGNLKSHYRINHSTENLVKCEFCEFSTSSRKLYREHMKTHDVEKPIKCPECQYTCANRPALKNHQRIHSDERPFKCDYCSYTSKQSGNVRTHMKKKHSGKLAGRKSTEIMKSALASKPTALAAKHMVGKDKSKSGIKKKFQCNMCDASFVRDDSLRSHMRQHREMVRMLESTAMAVLQLQYPTGNGDSSQQVDKLMQYSLQTPEGTSTAPVTSNPEGIATSEPSSVPHVPQVLHPDGRAQMVEPVLLQPPPNVTATILQQQNPSPGTPVSTVASTYTTTSAQPIILSQSANNLLAFVQNSRNAAIEENMQNAAMSMAKAAGQSSRSETNQPSATATISHRPASRSRQGRMTVHSTSGAPPNRIAPSAHAQLNATHIANIQVAHNQTQMHANTAILQQQQQQARPQIQSQAQPELQPQPQPVQLQPQTPSPAVSQKLISLLPSSVQLQRPVQAPVHQTLQLPTAASQVNMNIPVLDVTQLQNVIMQGFPLQNRGANDFAAQLQNTSAAPAAAVQAGAVTSSQQVPNSSPAAATGPPIMLVPGAGPGLPSLRPSLNAASIGGSIHTFHPGTGQNVVLQICSMDSGTGRATVQIPHAQLGNSLDGRLVIEHIENAEIIASNPSAPIQETSSIAIIDAPPVTAPQAPVQEDKGDQPDNST